MNETETDRNATIKAIRDALRRRSGKPWSVTGRRGTAWGWIRITAPPARCTMRHRLKHGQPDLPENYEEYDSGEGGHCMTRADRELLGQLLGLDGPAHVQGESVPASSDYRREYIDRAEGRSPQAVGVPYWD